MNDGNHTLSNDNTNNKKPANIEEPVHKKMKIDDKNIDEEMLKYTKMNNIKLNESWHTLPPLSSK